MSQQNPFSGPAISFRHKQKNAGTRDLKRDGVGAGEKSQEMCPLCSRTLKEFICLLALELLQVERETIA